MRGNLKKVLIFIPIFLSINGYSADREYVCTYKVTFQSNPYDAKPHIEINSKLVDYKQKISFDFKERLVTREYDDIEWDGSKNIKVKQKRISDISKASRDLNVPNTLIYWHEERSAEKGISDGQVSIYSLSTWTKTTLTHSYISVVSAYDTHYNCVLLN
ncbi:MAG: hypothetical protein CBC42_04630 [Betaproteobacteria bacterium TMED82]|nr:MAG: hypothetical protein CBC42_04630 [Betaproteobacteria bacterium TMED82]